MKLPNDRQRQWMEDLRGVGGASKHEWLAAAGLDSPAVYGLFRQPEPGEPMLIKCYNEGFTKCTPMILCRRLKPGLFLNLYDGSIFEWDDDLVVCFSAASRVDSKWLLHSGSQVVGIIRPAKGEPPPEEGA